MPNGMGVDGYPAHSITSDLNIDQIVSMNSSDFSAWSTDSLTIALDIATRKVIEYTRLKMDLEKALKEQGAKKEDNRKEEQVASGEDSPTKVGVGENIRTIMQKVRQGEIDGIQLQSKGITLAEAEGLATAMEEIACAKKSTVKTLDLGSNKFGDEGVMAFSKVIANENSAVETLNLSYCGMTCVGAIALAEALVKNKTVTDLRISGNRIGTQATTQLANVVRSNSCITRLDVSLCRLDLSCASPLAKALATNSALTYIEFDYNGKAAAEIAEMFKNKSLKKIGLAGLGINDDTVKQIALALQENKETCLEEINMRSNDVTDEGAEMLVQALNASGNQTIKTISLGSNNVSCSTDKRIDV